MASSLQLQMCQVPFTP